MSVLLKKEIKRAQASGVVHIQPYDESCIGPNSYDVRLDSKLSVYVLNESNINIIYSAFRYLAASVYRYFTGSAAVTAVENYLDCKKENKVRHITIPEEGMVLQPGILYLGSTCEEIGSDHYIPMYEGRSSMARLGIQSHISAGFGDIGFKSNWTLEIQVTHPVKVYPNMRIGQVYFHAINPTANVKENRYNGKYAVQGKGPQKSKSYLDK